jgi:hypothetical protein
MFCIYYPQSGSQKKREKRKAKKGVTDSSEQFETRRTCGSAPAPPVDGIILVMALVKRTGPGKTRRDEGDVGWVDWMDWMEL